MHQMTGTRGKEGLGRELIPADHSWLQEMGWVLLPEPWVLSKLQIPPAKHSTTGLSRKPQIEIQASFPLFRIIVLLPFYHRCHWWHLSTKAGGTLWPGYRAAPQDESSEERCWIHQVSRSWRCLWLFSSWKYKTFHWLSPLIPLHASVGRSMLADTQLHLKLCSPTILGYLLSETGPIVEPQNAHLTLHRIHMKVFAPLEQGALSWIERLDERTPKLGYTIWSLTRIWLYRLFVQHYWLLPLPSPSEITGMQCGFKVEAVWEFVGQDPAGQEGVSGAASPAPVSGCLLRNEFTHDGGTAFNSSCDKETPTCFKQAAARVVRLWANESDASCLGQPVWALLPLSGGKLAPNVHSV